MLLSLGAAPPQAQAPAHTRGFFRSFQPGKRLGAGQLGIGERDRVIDRAENLRYRSRE